LRNLQILNLSFNIINPQGLELMHESKRLQELNEVQTDYPHIGG